jgi:PTS system cellobiose-specific IIB component
MRILLVCAGGMSSGLLMRQMSSYLRENGIEGSVDAIAMISSQDRYTDYDVVLVAPQVGYRLANLRETTGLPCAVIPSFDYATANCTNIMRLVRELQKDQN